MGSPWVRRSVAAVGVVLATGVAWHAIGQTPGAGPIHVDRYGDRLQTVPAGTLPGFAEEWGPKTRSVYAFAASDAGKALEWIPCYCGCGNIGHGNNRACYIKELGKGTVTFTSHGGT